MLSFQAGTAMHYHMCRHFRLILRSLYDASIRSLRLLRSGELDCTRTPGDPQFLCLSDLSGIGEYTRLESLQLDAQNLTSLPPEIGKLKNLLQLIVNSNELTSLPPEIGGLTSLRILSLAENKLTSLPPEIGQLRNLSEISLARNSDFTPAGIPAEMAELPNLHRVYLLGTQITPSTLGSMPEAVRQRHGVRFNYDWCSGCYEETHTWNSELEQYVYYYDSNYGEFFLSAVGYVSLLYIFLPTIICAVLLGIYGRCVHSHLQQEAKVQAQTASGALQFRTQLRPRQIEISLCLLSIQNR